MNFVLLKTFATITLVVLASLIFSDLWGGKPEKLSLPSEIVWVESNSLKQFSQANHLTHEIQEKVFGADFEIRKEQSLASLGLEKSVVNEKVRQAQALAQEHAGKNWKKIIPKLALWVVFLLFVLSAIKKGYYNRKSRRWYSLFAVVLFGVAFGSDPSPMGTVKDAIVLFSTSGAIFPPRMLALVGFILTVVLANKSICAWGCQLGTFQELLFRWKRNKTDTRAQTIQFKIPFWLSNSVRISIFIALILTAVAWGIDIIEPIDPFKVFNPRHLGIAGGIFAAILLVLSAFTYRPWCHLACPFGLVGWVFERLSFYRIRVREEACTKCEACVKACPSQAMAGILHNWKMPPDCFSCVVCAEICPTHSIVFGTAKDIHNTKSERVKHELGGH